jgi:phosphatidylglycerophosphate synthase
MPEYKPTSRRPIGDAFRKTAHGAVQFCVDHNIHPDTISYCSVVAALIAAILFWQSGTVPVLLLIAPVFMYLRLWCNMLDGMVALASGKASWRGEVINELPDRISDVLVFAGVAESGLASTTLGYWAAIFALLTAYVGIMGQAVGAKREFGGFMSKPWRMVALHLGAWMTFILIAIGKSDAVVAGWNLLDWALFIIIIGCAQTIWVRLSRIMGDLKEKARK